MRRGLLASALAAAALFTASCGGNTSGDFTINPLCLTFTPAAPPAPPSVVARTGAGSTCTHLEIELVASGVSGVFGAAFTFKIAPFTFLVFDEITAGPFLTVSLPGGSVVACDGATHDGVSCFALQDPAGTFTVAISREDGTADAPADGQVLATLSFVQISGVGLGQLTFSDARLLNGEEPPTAIPGTTFSGGQLVVQ